MQTSIAKFYDDQVLLGCSVHIMSYSGSQKSYITNDLRQELNLKPIGTGTINVKTFGSTEGKCCAVDLLKLRVDIKALSLGTSEF